MPKIKTVEEASRRWVNNSIQANPDRIYGIIKTYFQGRQSLKWAVSLLKNEDWTLVSKTLETFKDINPEKYDTVLDTLNQK